MSGIRRFRFLLLLSITGAVAAAPSGSRAERKSEPSGPVEESPSERRAVRGVPVDGTVDESPELKELRRFEEQAFPRDAAVPLPPPDPEVPGAPPSLPGRWQGTGDIPSELRTPEVARRADRQPATPESEWLRSLELPELPVRWDPQVLRYLEFFRSDPRGRSIMTNWLRHLGRFQSLFATTLGRQGAPRDLIYLAMIESGFDPRGTSSVGAGGVWQFMPQVARAYGLEVSHWVDARRDPEAATVAAARYLKDLYVRFGSWHLAFAAYHAGYGAILRSIARYNTNDYWELCRHEAGLPWETTLYVPKILAAAVVGHNLAKLGFADVAPDPPFAYDRIEAAPGTTLQTIARAAGTRIEVIQSLNPQLSRDRVPPDRGRYPVRIPAGSASLYAEAIERSRSGADKVETVVLRFGETLDDVARARGLTAKELRRLNGVRDSAEVRAGVTIVVPRRADGDDKAAAAADEVKDERAPEETIVAVPDRVFSYQGRDRVFYQTRDSDTLEEIANVFGVSADDLVEWNNLDPNAKLHPKMVLQVFVRKDFDSAGVLLLDPTKVRVVTLGSDDFLELAAAKRGKKRLFYTAKAGDTLAKVGRRYGLSAGDLARINRFSYSTELSDGQRIVVYAPTGELPRETTMGRTPEPKRPTGKVDKVGAPKRKGNGGKHAALAVVESRKGSKTVRTPAKAAARAPAKRK